MSASTCRKCHCGIAILNQWAIDGQEGLFCYRCFCAGGIKPPPKARPDKAEVEFAAESVFISDGGQEAALISLLDGKGNILQQKTLSEVVGTLCHHLGVKE